MEEKPHLSKKIPLIALISSIIFVPALCIFLFTLFVKTTFLAPGYYKQSFKHINGYERTIQDGIPSLIFTLHISDDQLTDSLAKELVTLFIRHAIDPAWLESTGDIIAQKLIYLLEHPAKTVSLSMDEFNVSMVKLSKYITLAEAFIPSCQEPVASKAAAVKTQSISLLPAVFDCANNGAAFDEIKQDLRGIQKRIDTLQLSALQLENALDQVNHSLMRIRLFAHNINLYLWISLGVVLVTIFGISIAYRGNWFLTLRLITLAVGISSILLLSIGIIGSFTSPATLDQTPILLSPAIRLILTDYLEELVNGFFLRIQYSGLILLIGALVVFFGITIAHRSNTRSTPEPEKPKKK